MEKSFHVINDFLSSQEVEALLKMVIDGSGEDPKPLFEGTGLLEKHTLTEGGYPDFDPDRILLKIIDKVVDYHKKTYESEMIHSFGFSRMYGITMLEGAVLPSHTDADANAKGEFDGVSKSYICSVILNDDHEGGELVFEDYNESIKPQAGSLVMFPGHRVHHGVAKVTKGIRRVILVVCKDEPAQVG
jgi:hypothetical protein